MRRFPGSLQICAFSLGALFAFVANAQVPGFGDSGVPERANKSANVNPEKKAAFVAGSSGVSAAKAEKAIQEAKTIDKLGPACLRYYLATLLDTTHETVLAGLNNVESLLSYGIGKTERDFNLRRRLVAMAKSPEIRDGLRQVIYSDLFSKSDELLQLVEQATSKGKVDEAAQVYDALLIGSGAHDSIAARAIQEANPNLKFATIEGGDRVATTFDKDGFLLNSQNRKGMKDAAPTKGVGNQNELPGGIIQIPDIEATNYPVAQQLADVVLMNRATVHEAPILFNTEVLRVEERAAGENWPARYKVKTNRGEFYANHIVNNSGLGRELKLPASIPAPNKAMIELERVANTANPKKSPLIQSVAEYFDRLKLEPEAFKDYADQEIAIIGAGDSSNTLVESLLGFGPRGSYGNAVAQDGRFKTAYWIGQQNDDCEKLLTSLRQRYNDVIIGVKSKKVLPDPNKLANVEKLPNGRFRVTTGEGALQKSIEVDRVIFGTGFESETERVFAPILANDTRQLELEGKPFENSAYLRNVNGSVPGYANTVIGRQLVTQTANGEVVHDIYFNGPSAGRIVADNELRNVKENAASLFNTGPRTQAQMKYVFGKVKPGGFAKLEKPKFKKLLVLNEENTQFAVDTSFVRAGSPKGVDDITAKALLYSSLDGYEFTEEFVKLKNASIRITRDPKNPDRFIFNTPLYENNATELATRIQSNDQLLRSIRQMIGPKASYNSIEMNLAFSRGKLNQLKSDIRFFRDPKIKPVEGKVLEAARSKPKTPNLTFNAINPIKAVAQNPELREVVEEVNRAKVTEANYLDVLSSFEEGPKRQLAAYLVVNRLESVTPEVISEVAQRAFPSDLFTEKAVAGREVLELPNLKRRDEFILSQIPKLKQVTPPQVYVLTSLAFAERDLVAMQLAKKLSGADIQELRELVELVKSDSAKSFVRSRAGKLIYPEDDRLLRELERVVSDSDGEATIFRTFTSGLQQAKGTDGYLALVKEAISQSRGSDFRRVGKIVTKNLDAFFKLKPSRAEISALEKIVPSVDARISLRNALLIDARNGDEFVAAAKNLEQAPPVRNAVAKLVVQNADRFFSKPFTWFDVQRIKRVLVEANVDYTPFIRRGVGKVTSETELRELLRETAVIGDPFRKNVEKLEKEIRRTTFFGKDSELVADLNEFEFRSDSSPAQILKRMEQEVLKIKTPKGFIDLVDRKASKISYDNKFIRILQPTYDQRVSNFIRDNLERFKALSPNPMIEDYLNLARKTNDPKVRFQVKQAALESVATPQDLIKLLDSDPALTVGFRERLTLESFPYLDRVGGRTTVFNNLLPFVKTDKGAIKVVEAALQRATSTSDIVAATYLRPFSSEALKRRTAELLRDSARRYFELSDKLNFDQILVIKERLIEGGVDYTLFLQEGVSKIKNEKELEFLTLSPPGVVDPYANQAREFETRVRRDLAGSRGN